MLNAFLFLYFRFPCNFMPCTDSMQWTPFKRKKAFGKSSTHVFIEYSTLICLRCKWVNNFPLWIVTVVSSPSRNAWQYYCWEELQTLLLGWIFWNYLTLYLEDCSNLLLPAVQTWQQSKDSFPSKNMVNIWEPLLSLVS